MFSALTGNRGGFFTVCQATLYSCHVIDKFASEKCYNFGHYYSVAIKVDIGYLHLKHAKQRIYLNLLSTVETL